MTISNNIELICIPSNNMITRNIGGEIIIVPLKSGMVDGDDALYTLSPTAQTIWKNLDGKNTLDDVIQIISKQYSGKYEDIRSDILGFINEMIDHSLITIVD